MADEPEGPTTGDERIDAIVREHFSEAIDIARQVLADQFPEFVAESPERLDRAAALLVTQVWRPLAGVMVNGFALFIEQERES